MLIGIEDVYSLHGKIDELEPDCKVLTPEQLTSHQKYKLKIKFKTAELLQIEPAPSNKTVAE